MRTLFACAVLLSGCYGGGAWTPRDERDAAAAAPLIVKQGVYAGASIDQMNDGVFGRSFNFAQLAELYLRVKVQQLPPMSIVSVTLLTPEGIPAWEMTRPFATDDDQHEPVKLDGVEQPAEVWKAAQVDDGYNLDFFVPVLGTAIGRRTVRGTWVAKVTVDKNAPMYSTLFVDYR